MQYLQTFFKKVVPLKSHLQNVMLMVTYSNANRIKDLLHSTYLFILGFTSLSTMYRSYHDGLMEGQRKPVHTVGQGSAL